MHAQCMTPDPSILRYVMGVYKADEARGELIGHALVIERELNAWTDLREKEWRWELRRLEMEVTI